MIALVDQGAPVEDVRAVFGAIVRRQDVRVDAAGAGAVERYWCWLEGIAQYLDQQILRQSNPQAWVQTYARFCARAAPEPVQFYPALIGAAFAHALDYVTGNGLWKAEAQFIPGGEHAWFQFIRTEISRTHDQRNSSKR